MLLKKLFHPKPKQPRAKAEAQEPLLSPEELYKMSMESYWCYTTLSPGGFLDGFWRFY